MKSREVARFIVGPSGYGKSFLAAEYVEVMLSWSHSFWINAQSPCFVRDLDSGAIASGCLAFDEDASLVVFDDLPVLDDRRQESFSAEIDKLLARKCEVLATCVSSCDILGSLQPDRLRLGPMDLLLDDDEFDELRSADERIRRPASQVGPAARIPLLVWEADPDRAIRFVKGVLKEEVPSDLLCATASALVLQRGALPDLALLARCDKTTLADATRDYPHLGFDEATERFEAPDIEVDAIVPQLKRRLSTVVARSPFDSAEQLARAWAEILLENGRPARACSVANQMCSRQNRVPWALQNAVELVRQACFFPMVPLFASRGECDPGERSRSDALEALVRRVLGDEPGALRCAKRNAFNGAAPEGVRVLSQLVIARLNGGSVSARASAELEALAHQERDREIGACSNWLLLARAWQAGMEGIAVMASLWDEYADHQVEDDVLCVCASWLFSLYDGGPEARNVELSIALRRAQRYVSRRLAENASGGIADYYVASAGLAMEEAHARGFVYEESLLAAGSLIVLREVEMNVLSQRRQFEEGVARDQAKRSDWEATHSTAIVKRDSPAAPARSERSVPVLSLKMFGRFEVSIGGVPIDYGRFKRQNTRALLVLLAINQGREISRDAVAETMWPTSSGSVAHKNFYTVWSQLRKALSLPDGTCPYLQRHQYGCSLDSRYVQSDVDRLNAICRELLFSAPNVERWSTLFAELDRDFSSDLMPSERKNALIIQARGDYRARLVDALVAATVSAIDTDKAQWGVWFARAAIERDDTREDAYVALMRAQVAVNQRTAAMMTYLKCRRTLSERLGIDPAPETTALYESLLDSQ